MADRAGTRASSGTSDPPSAGEVAQGPRPRVLTERDVRAAIDARSALEVVREAFRSLDQGNVQMPPPIGFEFPESMGEAHLKGAHLLGSRWWTVKAATGFYGNSRHQLPANSGFSLVFSAVTGYLELLLLDNGHLTNLRTAAAGALATDLLANEQIGTASIIGAGCQARYQLESLLLVRRPERVLVASRSRESASSFVRAAGDELDVSIEAAATVEDAVRQADLIITVTPSREPIVRREWLRPGAHVTAVGADMAAKQELAVEVLAEADVVAADHGPAAASDGEVGHAIEAGVLRIGEVRELGALVRGTVSGRTSTEQRTVCDLVGLGVQDAVVAAKVAEEVATHGGGASLLDQGNGRR